MKKITLAAGQFVVKNDMVSNKKIILKQIEQAKKKRAKIILFPECGLTGYTSGDQGPMENLTVKEVDDALKEIGDSAKKNKIYVAVGSCYFDKKKKKLFNSVIVYNDKGKKVCVFSKMGLCKGEMKYFERGTELPTFVIDGVRFGLQICFDVRFAENYRSYFKKDVHVVLHAYHQAGIPEIAAQRRDLIEAFQRVRSSENAIYTITSNTIGLNKGKDQWIPTMVVNARGDVIRKSAPGRTGIIVETIQADDILENIEMEIRDYSKKLLGMKTLGKRKIKGN